MAARSIIHRQGGPVQASKRHIPLNKTGKDPDRNLTPSEKEAKYGGVNPIAPRGGINANREGVEGG